MQAGDSFSTAQGAISLPCGRFTDHTSDHENKDTNSDAADNRYCVGFLLWGDEVRAALMTGKATAERERRGTDPSGRGGLHRSQLDLASPPVQRYGPMIALLGVSAPSRTTTGRWNGDVSLWPPRRAQVQPSPVRCPPM